MTGQKPVAKFGAGQVSCAVWENEVAVNGTARTVLKATIQRRYKDAKGEWRSSQSFSRSEIPLAVFCLQKAFDAMVGEMNGEADNPAVEEEVVL